MENSTSAKCDQSNDAIVASQNDITLKHLHNFIIYYNKNFTKKET